MRGHQAMLRLAMCAVSAAGAAPLRADDVMEYTAAGDAVTRVSVAVENKAFIIRPEPGAVDSVATGSFRNELHSKGWGVLNVETNGAFPDVAQAYGAGMVEGYLTAFHINQAQQNLYPQVFGADVLSAKDVSPEVLQFMARQEAWSRAMVSKHGDSDDFWAHVGNLLAQLDGLEEGYAVAARRGAVPPLERFDFVMLNGVGDLFDVVPAVQRQSRLDWTALPMELAERMHAIRGHCSGLIKVPGDFSDIFMSHSSWFSYSNTNRIFKHFSFNYSNPSTASRQISYSSYPGFLESLDDFYLLESGLGWIQTTNTVVDHSVYDEVKPESLLAWQRVRVASAMAKTGQEWFKHMRRHFSGTYANQYMIVDFNRFKPDRPIQDGTLWVVEEMPGLMVGMDKSDLLAMGYWASYNIPFFPEVFNKSGYAAMAEKHGNYWTYELCPRAKIFRRDQASVVDMASLKVLMRSNNYKTDPYSVDSTGVSNPDYAICSRGDLHGQNATADGCYDTKVTSFLFGARVRRAEAVNGMTTSPTPGPILQAIDGVEMAQLPGALPPFSWDDHRFKSQRHVGLPTTYGFDFVEMRPADPTGFRARRPSGPRASMYI